MSDYASDSSTSEIGVATKSNKESKGVSPTPRMTRGETAAYTLWLLCAIALIFFGAACIFASNATGLSRATGVIFVLGAAGMGALAGKARQREVRFQRAAVALSMTFGLLQLAFVIVSHFWALVVTAIAMLVAAYLWYRDNSDEWVRQAEK
jgi:peptidoglycan/LPS O-acetylase OafA/YrhL